MSYNSGQSDPFDDARLLIEVGPEGCLQDQSWILVFCTTGAMTKLSLYVWIPTPNMINIVWSYFFNTTQWIKKQFCVDALRAYFSSTVMRIFVGIPFRSCVYENSVACWRRTMKVAYSLSASCAYHWKPFPKIRVQPTSLTICRNKYEFSINLATTMASQKCPSCY